MEATPLMNYLTRRLEGDAKAAKNCLKGFSSRSSPTSLLRVNAVLLWRKSGLRIDQAADFANESNRRWAIMIIKVAPNRFSKRAPQPGQVVGLRDYRRAQGGRAVPANRLPLYEEPDLVHRTPSTMLSRSRKHSTATSRLFRKLFGCRSNRDGFVAGRGLSHASLSPVHIVADPRPGAFQHRRSFIRKFSGVRSTPFILAHGRLRAIVPTSADFRTGCSTRTRSEFPIGLKTVSGLATPELTAFHAVA